MLPETLDIATLQRLYRERAVTPLEVVEAVVARCEAYPDPAVWISRASPAQLREQARQLMARGPGPDLPLWGIPFAAKDNIDCAGFETTAACPAFAYPATRDATVVAKLKAAGAILVGKTNLDQFATGLNGTRSPYGAPRSVFDAEYISGGSSSGSAVAVAAGLVSFALGTDTAGSGRVPAAFNHLIGLKPTKGRWSTRGVVPACRSLDCVTVLASSATDAARVDDVAAGFDAADPYSRREPAAGLMFGAAFRVGVPRPDQLEWFGDHQSKRLFEAAAARVAAMGGLLAEIDIAPLSAAAELLYQGPWVAERTAAVEPLLRARPSAIHPIVRAILERGLAMTAVEAFRGEYQLRAYQRDAERLWEQVDVLLLPTAATTYRVREVLVEPMALNANLGVYTNFVNLLDMSAIAAPAGFRDNATGFGVTLIGPAWADRSLLALARRYEEIAPMPDTPPLDLTGRDASVKLAVVGAHLGGMPLHWQLTSRDARLVRRCKTASAYRLYAMAGSIPPKPALAYVGDGGAAIEVEVYELGVEAFGSFVAEVPAPLAIGTVSLDDGSQVKGFVAEPRALDGAEDITALGGWRAYIAQLG